MGRLKKNKEEKIFFWSGKFAGDLNEIELLCLIKKKMWSGSCSWSLGILL